jgi:hypothetical protein
MLVSQLTDDKGDSVEDELVLDYYLKNMQGRFSWYHYDKAEREAGRKLHERIIYGEAGRVRGWS